MVGISPGVSPYGIVGFSFGLRTVEEEPNPSNEALGLVVAKASRDVRAYGGKAVVVTQWEITKALAATHQGRVEHSVELHPDGHYLDSKDVWEAAKKVFEARGVHNVIVIAQPFLHLPRLKAMVKADGYSVVNYKVGRIPFDNSPQNTQPWTRTRPALLNYAFKSLLPGAEHGHNGRQNAS